MSKIMDQSHYTKVRDISIEHGSSDKEFMKQQIEKSNGAERKSNTTTHLLVFLEANPFIIR